MSGSNPLILVKSSQAGLQCRLLESPFRRGFKSWRCLLPGADDENFDGLSVGFGVAVEFEGEFEVDWPWAGGGLVGGGEEGLSLHDDIPKVNSLDAVIIVDQSGAVNS
jgi:hypothetical protein